MSEVAYLCSRWGTATASLGNQIDGRTLLCPVPIVQVVKPTGVALVENGRAIESKGIVRAIREAVRFDGVRLRWRIELELVIAGNIPE